jgi:hypothetical protein
LLDRHRREASAHTIAYNVIEAPTEEVGVQAQQPLWVSESALFVFASSPDLLHERRPHAQSFHLISFMVL